MVRGPIVFIRFSKRSVKQKDVKQILYGINWQQKKRAMMSIRFNFSSLRSWREEQIHDELAILYQSLPSSFLTLLCPSLGSRRRTLGTPSPGLPYQTVLTGWCPVEVPAGGQSPGEKRGRFFPPPFPSWESDLRITLLAVTMILPSPSGRPLPSLGSGNGVLLSSPQPKE